MKRKKHNYQPYSLGLDLGIASVGAALLGRDRILSLHVRTFDKAETSDKGESLNKIRRESRLTRRRIRRRVFRMNRLLHVMHTEGLILTASKSDFANFLRGSKSPWQLRGEGLDRKLTDLEWAAVIYHLIKHRGFQSNKRSQSHADKETGAMLKNIEHNRQLCSEKKYRTVGEMINCDSDFKHSKRNKQGDYHCIIARDDIEKELKILFNLQRAFDNCHANSSFERRVHELLMLRKPILSGQKLIDMVGWCTFEKKEKRAPKAGYRAERFTWLTKLNHLRIVSNGETRKLMEQERLQLLDLPFVQVQVTYKQVRKKLNLMNSEFFNGLRYDGNSDLEVEKAVLFNARYFHEWRKAYEKSNLAQEWRRDSLNPDRLDTFAYALTCFKEDQECRSWLVQQGIETPIIEAALTVHCDKFIHLSTMALTKILPYLEQGMRYDESVVAAGYLLGIEQSGIKSRYLPRLNKEELTNPVVYRALNQARKLVNAIIHEYGSPTEIHIELARDLSKSKEERDEIAKKQEKLQDEKSFLVNDFKEKFPEINQPLGFDLLKYRLYKQQNSKCAYCQKEIVLECILEKNYVEIDHILPYSRSFDDSLNNKVLVHILENRNKGNQTPYEYLSGASDTDQWQKFAAWVECNKQLPRAKCDRLLRKDFSDNAAKEFRERHLNDTRYITRFFKNFIENHLILASNNSSIPNESSTIVQQFNQHCVVVTGQLTAYLRTRWGLVKERESGDLHHALDAAVVAACSRSMIKRISDYARCNELQQVRTEYIDPSTGEILNKQKMDLLEKYFPQPWPYFRNELLAYLSSNPSEQLSKIDRYNEEERQTVRPIRVSRMATHRNLGRAHKETIHSKGKNGEVYKQSFSVKKVSLQPIVRSVKLKVKQKSGVLVREGVADNGDILRIDIFIKLRKYYVVPIYMNDTVHDCLPQRATLAHKAESEWPIMDDSYTFLFSLYPNDWVKICTKKGIKEGYYCEFDRSTAGISLYVHDRNPAIGKGGKIRTGIKTALSIEKYHVDFLGRIYKAPLEIRQKIKITKGDKVVQNNLYSVEEKQYELA